MQDGQKQFYSVADAAGLLGVTPLTVRRYIYRGLLKSFPTPGGHHRIAAHALKALHGDNRIPARAKTYAGEQTLLTLMSRLNTLEQELELLKKQLSVVSHGCVKLKESVSVPPAKLPTPGEGAAVIVLGPGCQACDSLAQLAQDVICDLKYDTVEVRHIKDMEVIAEYGPLLTPALVFEGSVMVSGTVPSREKLAALLKAKLQ